MPSPSKGGKKPVYLLEYSPENKDQLKQYVKLYESGIVRFKPLQKNGKTEVVNIRSEIKTSDRIAGVINQLETDEELRSLALNLINSADPKTVLDGFKAASGF